MNDLKERGPNLRDDPDKLLSYEQLAAWIGVPERSIRKWVSDGTGPKVLRLGRYARIRVSDALDWLDQKAAA